MFSNVSSRLLPSRSGMASVRSSRTATNPAGSPFGETSSRPSDPRVAIITNGERGDEAPADIVDVADRLVPRQTDGRGDKLPQPVTRCDHFLKMRIHRRHPSARPCDRRQSIAQTARVRRGQGRMDLRRSRRHRRLDLGAARQRRDRAVAQSRERRRDIGEARGGERIAVRTYSARNAPSKQSPAPVASTALTAMRIDALARVGRRRRARRRGPFSPRPRGRRARDRSSAMASGSRKPVRSLRVVEAWEARCRRRASPRG